ncbi:MAG: cell division topological specificity factor MinE [Trichodesmium sp. St16_bin4-tuft]|uniref:Cell division topological specificity factor n=1 Tax=Trichodesmium erythraeum (strain IMS101) TaxID=203124 RepID=MINE_TRIEI|nr:RecName: Full=Cell division topological specificity factor [Trichodesmium erythraeum IMS101]MBS9772252.1 cell division topological specificity factor MinE [Trichodesmium erythraeum GBRTRLIN201]MCH2048118.1 cell division topological specificity factor MinE [Trichodesmium sp. ALOHA_ZT_67]MCL2927031.1 cell division topological specificity factor MinE [Trichodesmium sp. MAG_R01]MDE5067817.1 cell division topological specificity factor MinE [Trichodesmium sp. St4_bin8_1]MDE5072637.1 cell divisio
MLNEIIEKLFYRNNPKSREEVKRRLKLVIAHDRADLNPEIIQAMRKDIIDVVSRYVEIDDTDSEFLLENNQRATSLVANLPIRRIKAKPTQDQED